MGLGNALVEREMVSSPRWVKENRAIKETEEEREAMYYRFAHIMTPHFLFQPTEEKKAPECPHSPRERLRVEQQKLELAKERSRKAMVIMLGWFMCNYAFVVTWL